MDDLNTTLKAWTPERMFGDRNYVKDKLEEKQDDSSK